MHGGALASLLQSITDNTVERLCSVQVDPPPARSVSGVDGVAMGRGGGSGKVAKLPRPHAGQRPRTAVHSFPTKDRSAALLYL